MAYRTVMITKPCYLNITNSQLTINQKDGVVYTVPLEDIACILIDNYAVTLSAALLSRCADYNVVIISCSDTHIPNGIFYSYLPHSRQSLVLDKQLNLTIPFKKKLWQQIISQKIFNQAVCLQRINGDNHIINRLLLLSKSVNSGDTNNSEALASKLYFNALFGSNFIRVKKNTNLDDIDEYLGINTSLNYTYSIVRSLICRVLVGYGLLPIIGVFHNNQLNAFNLADDFIESLRPFVDWYVYDRALYYQTEDLIQYKMELVNILNHIVKIDDKHTSVLNACEIMIKSFINVINNGDISAIKLVELPTYIRLVNMD